MQLAGLHVPPDDITPQHVHEATDKVKQMLLQLKKAAETGAMVSDEAAGTLANAISHKNVLIAGQLGIIIHQLRQAISKLGGEVSIAKDVDEAIKQYQKADYSLVIIDLFMPTEREGMIVLEEIRRISVVCHINTQIIVLAPISKDKKGLSELCKAKGATFFLEKGEQWHTAILKYYQGEIPSDQVEQY